MQGIRSSIAQIFFRRIFLILFSFTTLPFSAEAQQNFYDSDLPGKEFHSGRRAAFKAALPANSIAVLFSNPVRNRSNDVDFQYIQDPDFYYLTGVMEPHAVLVIANTPLGYTETLFVRERDSLDEIWNGRRLGPEGAREMTGIDQVFSARKFRDHLPDLASFDQVLVKFPTDIRESKSSKPTLNALVYQFRQALDESGKETNIPALLRIMATLREIKLPAEIELLQKAVDITCEGFAEVMSAIRPGFTEYQAQAVVEFYFKYRGAEYPGYGSIAGGGENSCVLHYVTNRKKLSSGDLLLMDMGAEYHGYTADITRTIPVNGKFSPEQRIIYDLVLKAQEAGISACVTGNSFHKPHQVAMEIIGKGLVDLGIISKSSDARKYFNHGTSHYLGLEVHDPGSYGPLKPGVVLTVEPGIYIPPGSPCDKKWWNIGIRIEDNILITENEPFVMSGKLVKSAIEIEKLMEEASLFDSLK
jgi:Xaa-Pro aminopeptidase